MSDLEYEKDLRIDPDNLDLEWLDQPTRFRKYSEMLADADMEVKRAHEKLKTVRSELVLEVNNSPELAGVKKATAPVVEAYYRTHEDYVGAKEAWMGAEHEADLLRVAVFAFNQRKAALENLVRLNGQDYFAAPSAPKELGDKMRELSEASGKKSARDKVRKRGKK